MRFAVLFLAALLAPGLVVAQDEIAQKELKELLRTKMRTVQHMALNPALIAAVRRQNAEDLDMKNIEERDGEWKAADDLTPFKRSLQENRAGKMLRRYVSRNASLNEAFLTDNQGANVAAFPATSDYWQGDEEKWTASFNQGAGRLFLGPVERDESTNTIAVQVSAPLFHQGETIGVLVVGVTLDYLSARRESN